MRPAPEKTAAALDAVAAATAVLDNNRRGFRACMREARWRDLPEMLAEAALLMKDAAAYSQRALHDLPGDGIDIRRAWADSREDITIEMRRHGIFPDEVLWQWLDSVMIADDASWVPAADGCTALAAVLFVTQLTWQKMPRDEWPLMLASREA